MTITHVSHGAGRVLNKSSRQPQKVNCTFLLCPHCGLRQGRLNPSSPLRWKHVPYTWCHTDHEEHILLCGNTTYETQNPGRQTKAALLGPSVLHEYLGYLPVVQFCYRSRVVCTPEWLTVVYGWSHSSYSCPGNADETKTSSSGACFVNVSSDMPPRAVSVHASGMRFAFLVQYNAASWAERAAGWANWSTPGRMWIVQFP